MRKIEYINTSVLHPHPDNPRKDLGDLTELADSIKAKYPFTGTWGTVETAPSRCLSMASPSSSSLPTVEAGTM